MIVEDIPTIEILLRGLRHIAKRIKLLYSTQLAGERFDTAVDSAGFFLGEKIECDEDEVTTS